MVMPKAERQALVTQAFNKAAGNKFKAQRFFDADSGEWFDSKGEFARWKQLVLLQRAGAIKGLERQVRIDLFAAGQGVPAMPVKIRSEGVPQGRQAFYKADFVYTECKTGRRIVEDFKGKDTAMSRLKRAIVENIIGTPVLITKAGGRRV